VAGIPPFIIFSETSEKLNRQRIYFKPCGEFPEPVIPAPHKVATSWRAGILLKLITYRSKYEIPDQVRDDAFTLKLIQRVNFSEVSSEQINY
jgi:hypothetical protein